MQTQLGGEQLRKEVPQTQRIHVPLHTLPSVPLRSVDRDACMTYGCHNRAEYRAGYKVQDGHFAAGRERIDRMDWVPHRLTRDCQYTKTELGRVDPKCVGCKWRVAQ